ncbi:hypothetical protein LINPERHAP1_LOCUS31004, partial [Linum perenne]
SPKPISILFLTKPNQQQPPLFLKLEIGGGYFPWPATLPASTMIVVLSLTPFRIHIVRRRVSEASAGSADCPTLPRQFGLKSSPTVLISSPIPTLFQPPRCHPSSELAS